MFIGNLINLMKIYIFLENFSSSHSNLERKLQQEAIKFEKIYKFYILMPININFYFLIITIFI